MNNMKTFYAQLVGLVAGTIGGWLTIAVMSQVLIGALMSLFAGPIISICLYKVISERLTSVKQ